ncbi:MAG TPA: addiction module toxin RelE, partial [Terricaulis sp.]|nr:addiction module toxin RelE [Terricaulis sp.]
MNKPLHTVAFTDSFLKDCAAAGIDEAALKLIGDTLAADPAAGDLIRESAGARKVRIARPGQGKSGGYRLITAYVGSEAPLYALALYA